MNRSLLFIATTIVVVGCLEPALAQRISCTPVLAKDETDFVSHDRVPAYPGGFCYTFSVLPRHHVDITVTPKVDMQLGVEVRDAGTDEYHDLLGGVTSFSNFPAEGRVQVWADTSTDGHKDFLIWVEPSKIDPDTSREFTFHVSLKSNK